MSGQLHHFTNVELDLAVLTTRHQYNKHAALLGALNTCNWLLWLIKSIKVVLLLLGLNHYLADRKADKQDRLILMLHELSEDARDRDELAESVELNFGFYQFVWFLGTDGKEFAMVGVEHAVGVGTVEGRDFLRLLVFGTYLDCMN